MMYPFHEGEYSGKMVYLLLFFITLFGCQSDNKRIRKENLKGEYLVRKQDEFFFTPLPSKPQVREMYPWEKKTVNGLFKITKDYFRCKGDPLNPVLTVKKEGKATQYFRDCLGGKQHGLPLKEGKEFIYPCLIEILNFIQEKTGKKIVITTGHRCPQHNSYCDQSPSNWGSKHMMGAEVDFYVESMEEDPEAIIKWIMQYYEETYPKEKDYRVFLRFEKEGMNVRTFPWYNKEIFIKLYLVDEGRDADNRHTFPYIGIQVRHDRETDSKVTFDAKLTENYLRH